MIVYVLLFFCFFINELGEKVERTLARKKNVYRDIIILDKSAKSKTDRIPKVSCSLKLQKYLRYKIRSYLPLIRKEFMIFLNFRKIVSKAIFKCCQVLKIT